MEKQAPFDVIYELRGTSFVWNSKKSQTNLRKHKVAFEEAATVILNPSTIYYKDQKHSEIEERLIAIGFSENLKLLMVCHCLRDNDMSVRIISARKATKSEQNDFESR